MKVPKYIQDKIEQSAYYHQKANALNEQVFRWMNKQIALKETSDIDEEIKEIFRECTEETYNPKALVEIIKRLPSI